MGPNLEMEGKSNPVIEASDTKQSNGSVPQDPQNNLIHCASNMDGDTSHMRALFDGKAKVRSGSEDVEVNISESTVSSDHGWFEAECEDTTENSSSFGNSISGTQNSSTLSDVEVESPFCGGNGFASMFGEYNGALPLRKKKLTDHWRRFIRPIMWRCKWIELQIKEFQSQAWKYDRELAEYDQRKQFEFEKLTLEGIDAKSRPFSCIFRRNKVMKRKKRKRVEETTDLASYISQHNLFSYCDHKRSVADSARTENDCGNLGNKIVSLNDGFEFSDGWSSLEFRDGENSLEQMLSKIEVVQSQVRQLKSRIEKVVSENPGKFCSINRLSLLIPCEALTGSDQNAASPKNGNGRPDRSQYISSQHISDCNMEELFMPGSAVPSHNELTPRPDTIEIKSVPQIGGSCENSREGILIHDQASEEELQNFERVISQVTEKSQLSARKLDASPPVMGAEADLPTVPHGQPSSSRSSVCNNKRKRGRRKSRLGKWSRRSSS